MFALISSQIKKILSYRKPAGPLGALQVDAEFYGRGLGMLVAMALSREIAESGQDICATIYKDKVHSLAIFKKMGFSTSLLDRIAPSWVKLFLILLFLGANWSELKFALWCDIVDWHSRIQIPHVP